MLTREMLEPYLRAFTRESTRNRDGTLFEFADPVAFDGEALDVYFLNIAAFHVGRLTGSHRICNH